VQGDGAPKLVPSDVSLDRAAFLPDEYVVSQDAKLDLYRRLGASTTPAEIETLQAEVRDRFGPLPPPAEAFFATAQLRVVGGMLGVEGVLVRGDEARITFRESAVPRMKALGGAFHDVQFQVEIRRAQPLALKLTRLGGAEMLSGLVRALRSLLP
jgi:transcription-repair coupling factor (superfamily II helicase)